MLQSLMFRGMVGTSRSMRRVYERIRQVARLEIPVLIIGESGTGKELVARALHAESERRSGPFHAVNTGILTRELVASELFGHEKGAFTGATTVKKGFFEIAGGGTLFLDEISTMDIDSQVNLLRIIETGIFTRVGGTSSLRTDVRVLAASNVDLRASVRRQTFRKDLFYRLNIFPVNLPPLRRRRNDIPQLIAYFTERYCSQYSHDLVTVDAAAMRQLVAYGWPGNVRELANVVLRLVVSAHGTEITEDAVIEALYDSALIAGNERTETATGAAETDSVAAAAEPGADTYSPEPEPGYLGEAIADHLTDATASQEAVHSEEAGPRIEAGKTIDQVEHELILETLRAVNGNRTKAAKLLGISRKSLYNKLKDEPADTEGASKPTS